MPSHTVDNARGSVASTQLKSAVTPEPGRPECADRSDLRYQGFFQRAPVALWDEDFSPVMAMLDMIRRSGITDLRAYFHEQPGLLGKTVDLVRLNDVNDFTVDLFEAEQKQSLLRSLADVFLPETEAMFVDELVTLWEGRRRFEAETTMRTLKGRRLNVIFTVAYEGANCERTLVSITDVTARKQAEQTVRQLASIVESSDDAIASTDLAGTITSWNRGAERLYGYAPAEVIGKPSTILIPPDRQEEERTILKRIRTGDRVDHYETIRRRKDGTHIEVSLSVSSITDAGGRVIGSSKIARDITDRKRAQERQKLLLHEMKHRIRNSLALVQSVANQTMLGATATEREAFAGRLQALAKAHDLLTLEDWNVVRLSDVVHQALLPFQSVAQQRLCVGGPDARLEASKAVMLQLALHELATNAVKYGALSNGAGRVLLAWELPPDNDSPRLKLRWQESGGPPVAQPTQKGFGSVVIERAVTSGSGTSRWDFRADGVVWSLELPLAVGGR